jgi:hypothetical protein
MLTSPRTFRCPNCKEMINDSMKQCPFCSVPVDPAVAQMIADNQERANQACNDASYLRTVAAAMYVFLGLSFVPFVAGFSLVAFVLLFFVVIVLLIRWQVKFGSLRTDDADYRKARRSWGISLALFLGASVLGFIVRVRPMIY